MRALLIVDHGSRRPEAHEHLEGIAALVRELEPGIRVYAAHMELAEPSIHSAVDRAVADGVTEIWVHPLFLVPGLHLSEDIPRLVESAATRHAGIEVHVTEPIGQLPDIARLILQTVGR
ncbi:MAG: hypothetical protein GY725_09150 [bacterium]|nr:hypothetical protein [bacterium]